MAPVIDEHVVEREVAVHDLGPEPRPVRLDMDVVTVENPRHERTSAAFDRADEGAEFGGMLEVPEQLATGGRVKEAAQGEIQTGMRSAELAQGVVGQLGGGRADTWKPFEQANEVRPVGTFDC